MAVWYRDVLYFKATRDADGIIFRDQLVSIQEQTSNCSYEGVEEILEALRKAKDRLNANVNFGSHDGIAVPDYKGEHHRMIKLSESGFETPEKFYYSIRKRLPVKKGDHVIVETARGIEYGSVVADPRDVTDDQVVQP